MGLVIAVLVGLVAAVATLGLVGWVMLARLYHRERLERVRAEAALDEEFRRVELAVVQLCKARGREAALRKALELTLAEVQVLADMAGAGSREANIVAVARAALVRTNNPRMQ